MSYLPVKFVNFLKSRLIFTIFYCFWIFVNKLSQILRLYISKSKRSFNMKPSTYFFFIWRRRHWRISKSGLVYFKKIKDPHLNSESLSELKNSETEVSLNCHLFTNRQVLHNLLEITKQISQLANYGYIEKTRFFFKLLLILPIQELATKHETLFVTNSSIKAKVPDSFTTSRSARLYA